MAELYRIFSGLGSADFAAKVSQHIGQPVGKAIISRFADGEIQIQIEENIRNANTYVIQSTSQPVNENLMELFLLVRTLKRASARNVIAVIPYFGYARQDRKTKSRVPISASDVAILLEAAGVDRVISVDLHSGQIQGFFQKATVDNLFAAPVLARYVSTLALSNTVVVSPDAGGVARAKEFMEHLVKLKIQNGEEGFDAKLAMIVKQRAGAGVVEKMDVVGADSIVESDCIIVDDIVDTAGTLCKAAEELKKAGAKRVYAIITHAVLSGPAIERIAKSCLEQLVVTDTIPLRKDIPIPATIKQISVATLVGETIRRVNNGESVSGLFQA
eukprot:TRINITY_DN665_c0_g1_i1.p1 TRINITY_DN665_c0_g1~~TRINITY_DN665_c0_g1_i1.p1  ORF type:complete len:330 (-),score=99.49 TRINITY_DN665_c0_g1_i1:424-1413(-)